MILRLMLRLRTWMRPRPATIVFLGDSLTEFWPAGDPRLFRVGRVNKGVAGQTSADLRARFARDVVALGPDAVHIMAGTNDLWFGEPGEGAAATLANLAAMVADADAHGIRAILAAPPPAGGAAGAECRHMALLAVLRDGVRGLCERTGALFVDYAAAIGDGGGGLRPAFTTDGVHLTRAGYRAMRRTAEQAIAAASPPVEGA